MPASESILIKCRFLDSNDKPKGRSYTYLYVADVVQVGNENGHPIFKPIDIPQFVQTPDGKKLITTGEPATWEEVEPFKAQLKHVTVWHEPEA